MTSLLMSFSKYFASGVLFSLLLILMDFILSLGVCNLFTKVSGFFGPVAVYINGKVVSLSPWKYIFITRSSLFITLVVFCAIGVFISCVFKRETIVFTTLAIPSVLLFLFMFYDYVKPYVFFYYRFQDFIFWEYGSGVENGTLIMALWVHGISLVTFLAGSLFICKKIDRYTEPGQGSNLPL
ncbi:hypothetical protein C8P63_1282 [Melghirimyces profundicolus]|uniref:Uncharacterized protein n=1 Tax=Melghirimyces profundicolus TaxID=1242148 RepID=A0A2T6BC24_9BACL|nr:hypothetical protein C8P63_1282 [Melghirimyces profundicolus]